MAGNAMIASKLNKTFHFDATITCAILASQAILAVTWKPGSTLTFGTENPSASDNMLVISSDLIGLGSLANITDEGLLMMFSTALSFCV